MCNLIKESKEEHMQKLLPEPQNQSAASGKNNIQIYSEKFITNKTKAIDF